MEKIAATRYKELLSGLSKASKKALMPFGKSLEDEIAGVQLGTENIAKSLGYKIQRATTEEEVETALGGGGAVSLEDRKQLLYIDPSDYRKGDLVESYGLELPDLFKN